MVWAGKSRKLRNEVYLGGDLRMSVVGSGEGGGQYKRFCMVFIYVRGI